MNWSTLTAAQLRGRLGSVDGSPHWRLPNRIRRGLVRVTFLNGDGTVYNRFDAGAYLWPTIEEHARQRRRSFRRTRNVAYVQARGQFDEKEAA